MTSTGVSQKIGFLISLIIDKTKNYKNVISKILERFPKFILNSILNLDPKFTQIAKNKFYSCLPKKWLNLIYKDISLLHDFFLLKVKILTSNGNNEILTQKEKNFKVEMLSLKALINLKILLSK